MYQQKNRAYLNAMMPIHLVYRNHAGMGAVVLGLTQPRRGNALLGCVNQVYWQEWGTRREAYVLKLGAAIRAVEGASKLLDHYGDDGDYRVWPRRAMDIFDLEDCSGRLLRLGRDLPNFLSKEYMQGSADVTVLGLPPLRARRAPAGMPSMDTMQLWTDSRRVPGNCAGLRGSAAASSRYTPVQQRRPRNSVLPGVSWGEPCEDCDAPVWCCHAGDGWVARTGLSCRACRRRWCADCVSRRPGCPGCDSPFYQDDIARCAPYRREGNKRRRKK